MGEKEAFLVQFKDFKPRVIEDLDSGEIFWQWECFNYHFSVKASEAPNCRKVPEVE